MFDGAGHVIDGSIPSLPGYANKGLSVEGVSNVTVRNVTAKGFTDSDVSIDSSHRSAFLNLKAERFHIRNSDFNTITENTVNSDNALRSTLMLMLHSSNNTIAGNIIVSLHLDFGCNNTFFNNNFFVGCYTINKGNFWDNGSIGNYWSGYDGADVNGDGIGDTP